MDVKEIIAKVEGMLGDEKFKSALKTNPAKALENALGVKISDDQVKAVLEAVKAKINLDNVGDLVKGAEKVLGNEAEGVSGVVKGAEEKIGGILGGILGKK